MKRIVSLLCAAIFVAFVFAGCTTSTGSTTSTGGMTSTSSDSVTVSSENSTLVTNSGDIDQIYEDYAKQLDDKLEQSTKLLDSIPAKEDIEPAYQQAITDLEQIYNNGHDLIESIEAEPEATDEYLNKLDNKWKETSEVLKATYENALAKFES